MTASTEEGAKVAFRDANSDSLTEYAFQLRVYKPKNRNLAPPEPITMPIRAEPLHTTPIAGQSHTCCHNEAVAPL